METNVKDLDTPGFEEAIEKDKPILIDFWADWCVPCKMTTPQVEAVSKERADVDFAKVNTDESMDVAAAYDIRSIPTFIIFQSGEEVARHTGAINKTQINQFIDSAMELTKEV